MISIDKLYELRKTAEDYLDDKSDAKFTDYNRNMIFLIDEMIEILKEENERKNKIPFALTKEEISNFDYSELPISATELSRKINMLGNVNMRSVRSSTITKGLAEMGYIISENGKHRSGPTEEGEKIGLIPEHRTSAKGDIYIACKYSKEAQKFVVENIKEIIKQAREFGRHREGDPNNGYYQ